MSTITRPPLFISCAALLLATFSHGEEFRYTGYYITFMRMPTYGLEAWKEAVDCFQSDGANLLLLWTAGAFRSRQFPITWQYNEEHENVRHDFLRQLIDYAHTKQIKVLLGFTPFAYDGVNQYPLAHPELKATQKNGQAASLGGIHCWGYNLCPSREESQRFMLEYVREMFFDFYPNADGLMIEASDYAICFCPDCGDRHFDNEFRFVERISKEIWAKKPNAMIAVYPHYFSGAKVPGFGVTAATQKFDPRWTLFFTPHSAHLDEKLIRQAPSSLWWDESPSLGTPERIQAGAKRAKEAGVSAYVPSLEAYSFVATHPEEGQQWLVGRRQVPLGFGWLPQEKIPYNELPIRVNRIAYREFSRNPELSFDEFKKKLGEDLFGKNATPQAVEDALELQRIFALERSWCQPSPLTSPEMVRIRKARGKVSAEKLAIYRAALQHVQEIEQRYPETENPGFAELHRIAAWVLNLWKGENAQLLGYDRISP